VLQGVTTEVTGNCGYSVAPLEGVDAEARRATLLQDDGIEATWGSVGDYLDRLEQAQVAANQILLLGQGTLRENVAGNVDRSLTPEEMKQVVRAVEEGMDHGAFGLSTGLEYTPGSYTPTDEIVAMTRVVARRGGFYASHIRNEEAGLLEAVDEAIEIGRRTGARVQISHLKAAGKPNWSKQRAALNLIAAARAAGVDVLADAYPYAAYSTGLTIFLETWAREGDEQALVARLRDPETRRRIRRETAARVRNDPGGFELIVISRVRTEKNRATVGMNLVEIAEAWSIEPVDALLRLLEEESGGVGFIGHGMSDANVEMVLAHPLVMIGSDGVSMAPAGKAAETRPHPRSYGAFARVLRRYVRERQLFDLPTAIRKMTSMPADQVGLRDRGRLARGRKADLVVFDAAGVEDRATFERPHQYAGGIVHVLVNGRFAMEQGRHTDARAGAVLRQS
jgi:N-acyl-D-amino-acid deacylase